MDYDTAQRNLRRRNAQAAFLNSQWGNSRRGQNAFNQQFQQQAQVHELANALNDAQSLHGSGTPGDPAHVQLLAAAVNHHFAQKAARASRTPGGAMRLPDGSVAPNAHGPLPHRTPRGGKGPVPGRPYVPNVLTRGGSVGDTNAGSVLEGRGGRNPLLGDALPRHPGRDIDPGIHRPVGNGSYGPHKGHHQAVLNALLRNREFGGNPGEIPRHPGSVRPYQRDTLGTQQRSYNANLTPGGSGSISNVQSNTQSSRGNRHVSEVERRTMYVNGKRLDVPDIGPVGRRLRRMALKNIDASVSRSEDINRLVRGNIRKSRNRNRVR